jgi:hypothetical protein
VELHQVTTFDPRNPNGNYAGLSMAEHNCENLSPRSPANVLVVNQGRVEVR